MLNPYEPPAESKPVETPLPPGLAARKVISIVARYAAYVFLVSIVLAATACVWAIAESHRPGTNPEVLMVLPGMSCFSLQAGAALLTCSIIAWRRLTRLERIVFGSLAMIGVCMLPALMALEFLGVLH